MLKFVKTEDVFVKDCLVVDGFLKTSMALSRMSKHYFVLTWKDSC